MGRTLSTSPLVLALAITLLTTPAQAQTAPPPPPPRAMTHVPSLIRTWGDEAAAPTLTALEQAFHRHHPTVRFEHHLYGSGTGMAGIITGVSDLALMGRPATANEFHGFEWAYRYKPTPIQIAIGNFNSEDHSPALAVFVPLSNPLTSISLPQLAAVLGCPTVPREAVATPSTLPKTPEAPTWATLGLTGPLAAKPIRAYLYDTDTGTGDFLQQSILGDADRWNWAVVHEFKDHSLPGGKVDRAATRILAAVARDPQGLAIATLAHPHPGLKALPLAPAANVTPVPLTRETLLDATYPLGRPILLYINRPPGQPIDPTTAAFLRFILSPEGQSLIPRQGGFLALSPASAQTELLKLD